MGLKVIITGATGMVGEGILHTCMEDPRIEKILLINRKSANIQHAKVEEIIHKDFNDVQPIIDRLISYDACYFCLGISSIGLKEEAYYATTYTLTMNFASQLAAVNPTLTFCYVSGTGTDSSERGKQMWARVKGKTENDLLKLPFKAVYNFRPAFMKPTNGAKNANGFFKFIGVLYPVLRLINKTFFLTLTEVGKAMIAVTVKPYSKSVLEVKDIATLGQS